RKVTEVACELGINMNQLHRWKRKLFEEGQSSFPGKSHLTLEQEELRRLRRELADVTEERDILKKAMGIFSRCQR
ncbi:MAG: IS3 family transposase, partial [Candidatus Zixiibacteriota bacterium]